MNAVTCKARRLASLLVLVTLLAGCDSWDPLGWLDLDSREHHPDTDGDGVFNHNDNCVEVVNAGQQDLDQDGLGDVCDPDQDGDGILDSWELSFGLDPGNPADAALDIDHDGLTALQEYQLGSSPLIADMDSDSVLDGADNCVLVVNVDQLDLDDDSRGDACDADIDGDGVSNEDEIYQGSNPYDGSETHTPATLTRLSRNQAGLPANGYSHSPALSADAGVVAFVSSATDLTAGDNNGWVDVFVLDIASGVLRRASEASLAGGNDDSLLPVVSADGLVVAFHSKASNLVPGDANGQQDVFVLDRVSGLLSLGNVSSEGAQAASFPSTLADLNGDGSQVFFNSNARNLAAGVGQFKHFLYCHDRVAGNTGFSPSSNGGSVADDSSWVAFESAETSLVRNDDNDARDIFLFDMNARETIKVSRTAIDPNADSDSFRPHISSAGDYVVFESDASDLVPNDTNNKRDIFLYQVVDKTIERVSLTWDGKQANGNSYRASVSSDGRYIAYASDASNLVQYDYNGVRDVFIYDRLLHYVRRVSVSESGQQADRESGQPRIADDGRCVVFVSSASALDALGDNQQRDVYRYCR